MSYHETYEFFAIDRRLTPAEMRALRAVSARATITPTRFYNFYDWGGLKGDPRAMLRRHFDLFVYTGNGLPQWGMLRFPADRVDRRRWEPYVAEERGRRPPARAAEPPRPPGLERPAGSLYAFAEFLRLNADLTEVALEAPDDGARTAGQLLDAARTRADERRRVAAERAAAARARRLAVLAERQEGEWSEIDRLLDAPKVKPSVYDGVVRRLTALQELKHARRRGVAV